MKLSLFKKINKTLDMNDMPTDMDRGFKRLYNKTKEFTMTSMERMYALYKSIKYISSASIVGDIVECGVWKGGSSMMAALTLLKMHDRKRKIYLYDTYAGMTEPTDIDASLGDNRSVHGEWVRHKFGNVNLLYYSPLNETKANLYSTGYPKDKIIFVKGNVERTIPKVTPKKISLLRLDTDWYKSTYHELKFLFPLLSKGGVLLIDDYGHWKGAKKATDTYIQKNKIPLLLNRIDYTGRIGIKYGK